jgi:hypothetical protein
VLTSYVVGVAVVQLHDARVGASWEENVIGLAHRDRIGQALTARAG